jgi:epsilon-lactone hydrolase
MSKTSQSIFGVLGAIHFKDRVDFMKPVRSQRTRIPAMPKKQYQTKTMLVRNRMVCTIQPLETVANEHNAGANVHIVYFHGGGYSMEASGLHFALMKTLVKRTGCTLSYVDYPLAPEHTVTETTAMSLLAYKKLKAEDPNRRFVLMGDSAGGGLALALAMRIRDEGIAGPEQIIVFSPWLDIALKNKRIPEYEKRDVILDVAALREIGEQYRGDVPADHYTVSPKYGNLTGLGKIAVFYGTEETLYPDCKEFCEESKSAGFPVTGYEYAGMQHDWVILPIEEAKRAIGEVCALVAQRDMAM